jgi:uncharacterized protein YecE (DUF72 family)
VKPRAYIGTSGWNYKHWRNLIYPPKTPQKRWLAFIAERFNTVEVNTSFYRIPKSETIAAWQDATPEHFQLALKLWRGITHYQKLKNSGEFTLRFLDVVNVLQVARRAPLLIQLPPNQHKDVAKLEEYIMSMRNLLSTPWMIAVEFRHDSWLDPEVNRMLDKHEVALCIHDMRGRAATETPNDAPFVYVRRHGTAEGPYAGSYSPAQIEGDARRILEWNREGKAAYAYYNNDIGGHAFWNAEQLRSIIDVK